jgi:isocitrate dehydrogenase
MGGQGFKITGELLHRSLQGNEHGITKSTIIYTLTDEAPLLATYSCCPSSRSSPHRLASTWCRATSRWRPRPGEFPEFLTDEQKVPNNLAELGN